MCGKDDLSALTCGAVRKASVRKGMGAEAPERQDERGRPLERGEVRRAPMRGGSSHARWLT
jgi:hypothetical protein